MLYYLHGYQSSPESAKGILFKKTLHATAIPYRDVPPEDMVIPDCLQRISPVIKREKNVILIGSSLGGFLAASTALHHPNVTQLILLNPAIIPPQTDLSSIQDIPRRILEEMRNPRLFEQKITADITILRAIEDDVVPDSWIFTFAKAQEATIRFLHDDHGFSHNLHNLPVIISTLLKQ